VIGRNCVVSFRITESIIFLLWEGLRLWVGREKGGTFISKESICWNGAWNRRIAIHTYPLFVHVVLLFLNTNKRTLSFNLFRGFRKNSFKSPLKQKPNLPLFFYFCLLRFKENFSHNNQHVLSTDPH
jgi:hypothetical protein